MGGDIDGEAEGDASGNSVAMSADGSRIVIGAMLNDGNGNNSGQTRIYQLQEDNTWVQLGDDIDGEAQDDYFGCSVAMSADGSRIAVGAFLNDDNGNNSGNVRIFDLQGDDTWVQVGDDIKGEAQDDRFGYSVAMSEDGSRISAGAFWGNDDNGINSGNVRIFYLQGENAWVQLGDDIDGEAEDDRFGWSVAMSADGSRIIVGAIFNNDNGRASGHVRIFEFQDDNVWLQLGDDIDGEAQDDQFGMSVAISANGSRIAVGSRLNDGNGSNSGHVRIFEFQDNNAWVQLGGDIDGEAGGDQFGCSVDMSADGSRIVVGARYNDGNGSDSGHVRIFDLQDDSVWVQSGDDINGEAFGDQIGYSVTISADGSRIAVGARFNDGNGSDSGHVRIYEYGDHSLVSDSVRKLERNMDMRHFEQARSAKEAEFATGFTIGKVATEGIQMTSGGSIANAVMARVTMGAVLVVMLAMS